MIRTLFMLVLLGVQPALLAQGPVRLDLRPHSLPPIPLSQTHLPAVWDYRELGLFCKLDVQLERRSPIPLVIRLGDVRAVDRWEGKTTPLLP
jgi:hypothetical protein